MRSNLIYDSNDMNGRSQAFYINLIQSDFRKALLIRHHDEVYGITSFDAYAIKLR